MANYEELAQVEALKQIQSESLEIARLERDLHIFENWRDKLYFPEPKHPGEYKDVHFIPGTVKTKKIESIESDDTVLDFTSYIEIFNKMIDDLNLKISRPIYSKVLKIIGG